MAEYVPLFQTLAWISLIIAFALYFSKEIKVLRDGAVDRVRSGSPFKLGAFEFGERIQKSIHELRSEVRSNQEQVISDVRKINERFESLIKTSKGFLAPLPLSETWEKIHQIKRDFEKSPMSNFELEKCLSSMDPSERLLGYLQLQIRPSVNRLQDVLDCLYLETFEARKTNETRPMWQALETIHKIIEANWDASKTYKSHALIATGTVEQFLERQRLVAGNEVLDQKGQCKENVKNLIARLDSM